MITAEILLANAYSRVAIQGGRVLYQKRVYESDTLLYTIDFEQGGEGSGVGAAFDGFEAVVTLFRPTSRDENACLVVRPAFYNGDTRVEDVEGLIFEIYQKLGCIPDPING